MPIGTKPEVTSQTISGEGIITTISLSWVPVDAVTLPPLLPWDSVLLDCHLYQRASLMSLLPSH